jgi:hypothetical protein
MTTVSEQLRKAVENCGESRYAITKATGIDKAVLSRFVASGKAMRSENIDKLTTYLGLELRPIKRPRKGN